MAVRPGRNDRCPCGSGQKFKKCCLNTTATRAAPPPSPVSNAVTSPPEVLAALNRQMRDEFERRRRFGHVRPLITLAHQGTRFVAVGSRLYYHTEWRTFTDFLLFYVRDIMGRAWWQAEEKKVGYQR